MTTMMMMMMMVMMIMDFPVHSCITNSISKSVPLIPPGRETGNLRGTALADISRCRTGASYGRE